MIDKEVINTKLSDIQKYFNELEVLLHENARDILEDNIKLHAVERLFQLIVDTAIDVNTHIIAVSDFAVPEDYQGTFTTLAENHVISAEFARRIGPSVGLRNMIVHKYGNVDMKQMIDHIKHEIGDYVEYLAVMRKFGAKE